MTGPLVASAGLVTGPGYTFNGATKTGFYLAGANQIGIGTNGIQAATVNSDQSVSFSGTVSAAKGTIPIGFVGDFAGSTAPAGWLLCFGQLVSTTTYAALFAVLSTTYGSGAGTFGIPDYRGRSGYGQDNMGGSAANRITIAGGNFDGTLLGNSGGGQNQTLTLSQIPTGINSTGTVNVTGTDSLTVRANADVTAFSTNAGGGSQWLAWATSVTVNRQAITSSGTPTLTSNNTGGGSHPIINPAIVINKIIYAGI